MDLMNCIILLFAPIFTHALGTTARITFITVLTHENCWCSFRSLDLLLCVSSSLMILEIHGLDVAVPADIALVVAVLIGNIFCSLHLIPFVKMAVPHVLVQSAHTTVWKAAETAAFQAYCGLVFALRLGTVGLLLHLSLGWLGGTILVFAALTQ